MSNEPVIPFRKQGRPEQLTREQLKGMQPEEIDRARLGGHLDDLMSGKKPQPAEQPGTGFALGDVVKGIADDMIRKGRA
jgi:hypothetical protein